MQIVAIAARTIRWPITGQGAARGRTDRAAVVVEVRTDRGAIGLGEAAPLPGMSVDTIEQAEAAITAFADLAPFELSQRNAMHTPDQRMPFEITDHRAAHAFAAAPPAARFAIETALLDALARASQISIAALLSAWVETNAVPDAHVDAVSFPHVGDTPTAHVGAEPSIHVSANLPAGVSASPFPHVSTEPPAHVSASVPAHVSASPSAHVGASPSTHVGVGASPHVGVGASPHVGVGASPHVGALPCTRANAPRDVPLAAVVDDPEAARRAFAAGIRCLKIKLAADDDVGRVFAIAAAAPGARLRIDANRSWPRAEVADRLAALAPLPIDYVEEPCRDAYQLLAAPLACKLALDESLSELAPEDLLAALRSPQLAAVILKPTLLGGLSAALELATLARTAGVAAIVSHALEGPIGTAACAELALALRREHPAGLAPHPALASWSIEVAQLAAGHVRAAAAPGLGFVGLDLAAVVHAWGRSQP
jgi:L-alanine-DL-glutamate epimerase-like enolase superfamily enzyme